MKKLATLLAFLLIPSVALSATDRYVAIYPTGSTNPSGYSATYTSMATMEAGEDGDLTAAGGTRLRVEITASDGTWENAPDDSQAVFDGWTCDYASGEYVWVYTVDTAKPSSPMFWDETAYIFRPATQYVALNIDNDFAAANLAIVFDDIQFARTRTGYGANTAQVLAASYLERLELNRCWIERDEASPGHGLDVQGVAGTAAEVHITNCVFSGVGSESGDGFNGTDGAQLAATYIVNSTFTGWSGDAIEPNNTNTYVINTALFYNADDFEDTYPAGYPLYCASDQGAGEGTNGIDLTPGVQATDLAVTFEQPAEATNLISNGGFETCAGCTANDGITDNFANWTESDGGGGGYIDWDSNEATIPEGTYVVDLHKAAGTNALVQQDISLASNTTYVFSLIGKSDGTGYMHTHIQDQADNYYLQDDGSWAAAAEYELAALEISSSHTSWTYRYLVFTTSANAGNYRFAIKSTVANSSAWADDVKLYAWPRVDFRLTGTTTTANLVNAGVSHTLVPKVDIVGVSREGRPDIGAFEYAAGNFWQRFLYFFRRR